MQIGPLFTSHAYYRIGLGWIHQPINRIWLMEDPMSKLPYRNCHQCERLQNTFTLVSFRTHCILQKKRVVHPSLSSNLQWKSWPTWSEYNPRSTSLDLQWMQRRLPWQAVGIKWTSFLGDMMEFSYLGDEVVKGTDKVDASMRIKRVRGLIFVGILMWCC